MLKTLVNSNVLKWQTINAEAYRLTASARKNIKTPVTKQQSSCLSTSETHSLVSDKFNKQQSSCLSTSETHSLVSDKFNKRTKSDAKYTLGFSSMADFPWPTTGHPKVGPSQETSEDCCKTQFLQTPTESVNTLKDATDRCYICRTKMHKTPYYLEMFLSTTSTTCQLSFHKSHNVFLLARMGIGCEEVISPFLPWKGFGLPGILLILFLDFVSQNSEFWCILK